MPVPSRIPRPSLLVHLVSLAAVAAVFVYIGRNQWFFFDEWDLLVTRSQWDVFAPHNGHLSFGLVLLITVLELIFGLHTYFPFLAVTIAVHLLLVHLLWRLMTRLGAHPLIALLASLVFAVLGAGSANTLWAFQTAFIVPLPLGIAVILLAMRPTWTRRAGAAAIVFMLVALSFQSTALPTLLVVVMFLCVRHGLRPAVILAAATLVPYGAWYLLFNLGNHSTAALGASSISDFTIGVPQYMVAAFVNGLEALGPFGPLAPVVVALIGIWALLELRRTGLHAASPAIFLTGGALAFGFIVAVTRLNVGIADAASGRYVYVYAALLLPLVANALTSLVRKSGVVLVIVSIGLVVIALFNGVTLIIAAGGQASEEQFTKRAISAVLVEAEGKGYDDAIRPLPSDAPQLTLGDIEDFYRRGELSIGKFSPSDRLTAQVGLTISATNVSPSATCAEPSEAGVVVLKASTDHLVVLSAAAPVPVPITVTRGGIATRGAQVLLSPGANRIIGFEDATFRLALPTSDVSIICEVH